MGKSAAAAFLRTAGVPVVDSDDLAREVVARGQPALEEIRAEFGPDVIGAGGELLRARLAEKVFANPAARQKLESITHPRIRSLWQSQLRHWSAEGHATGVVVIPLLLEVAAESEFDSIVCVACSAQTQAERVRSRGWTAEEITRRNAAQMPVEQKIARAHRVVWTEGALESTHEQLRRIFNLPR